MAEITKIGPRAHYVRAALDDRDPLGNADDFARLIEVALREDPEPRRLLNLLQEAFDCGTAFIRHWVTGVSTPAPFARNKAVAIIREHYGLRS